MAERNSDNRIPSGVKWTTAILGVIALAFYVGFYLLMYYSNP